MGVLTQQELWDEVRSALGNRSRTDIPDARITLALNLAQSRIARSYDFSEMGQVAFAQMNFTGNAAIDKYLVPPPATKSIHSFVVLDTSAAVGTGTAIGSGGVPLDSGGIPPVPLGTGAAGAGFMGIPPTGAIGSLGQSRKVVEKPWRWFDQKYPSPEWLPPGWPSVYKRFGNLITMVPAPFLQFTAQLSFTTYPTRFAAATPTQVSDFENKDDVIINKALAYFYQTLGRTDRAAYFEGLAKEQLDEAIERDDNRPDIEVSRDIPAIAGAEAGPYWANPWVRQSP
jgi:hypothetical protein